MTFPDANLKLLKRHGYFQESPFFWGKKFCFGRNSITMYIGHWTVKGNEIDLYRKIKEHEQRAKLYFVTIH